MKPVISLSTSYLQRSFGADGYAMLEAAAALGYEYVEISHSTPIAAVGGILKAVEDGVVKVSSTHNFCPLPPFVTGAAPDLYSPSYEELARIWRKSRRKGARLPCGKVVVLLF